MQPAKNVALWNQHYNILKISRIKGTYTCNKLEM